MELVPHPDLPQVSTISVPFTKTKYGALHELDVSILAEALIVSEMFDLAMRYHEINRFRSVVPPTRSMASSARAEPMAAIGFRSRAINFLSASGSWRCRPICRRAATGPSPGNLERSPGSFGRHVAT